MKKYPGIIENYVIAEAATASDEIKDIGNQEAIKNDVVRTGLRDYRQLMVLDALMVVSSAVPDPKQRPKFTPLSEDPPSIIYNVDLWEEIMTSLETQDIRANMLEHAKPRQFYDAQTHTSRDMTRADYRNALGMQVEAGDDKIIMLEGPENMKAGSDSGGRGSKVMSPLTALGRRETNKVFANSVITDSNGQKVSFFLTEHAGVGADKRRSQGAVNAPGSCAVETTQGMHNVYHYGLPTLDTILKQLAIVRRDHAPAPQENTDLIPDRLRKTDVAYEYEDRLSDAERETMKQRLVKTVYARMKVVGSVAQDEYLTHGMHAALSRETNYSARGGVRKENENVQQTYPMPVKFGGFRIIGFNKTTQHGMETETFIRKSLIPDDTALTEVDGVKMLEKNHRKQLIIEYVKNADQRQFILDSIEAMVMANFNTGWHSVSDSEDKRFELRYDGPVNHVPGTNYGANLATAKGYYVKQEGSDEKLYINDLAKLYEENRDTTDAKLTVKHKGVDLSLSQLMQAENNQQAIDSSRALYEIVYRIQHAEKLDGNLSQADEKRLQDTLRNFRIRNLEELMTPDQLARVNRNKALHDSARIMVATDHVHRKDNGGNLAFPTEALYHAATTYDNLFETGSASAGLKRCMETVQIPALKQTTQLSI